MTGTTAEASIPVDLANPGQVFACLGFLEAAEALIGGATAGFEWEDGAAARFRLAAEGGGNPVEGVLRFLDEAEVVSLTPRGSANDTKKWNIGTVADAYPPETFPFGDPAGPDVLPARLQDKSGNSVVIDHWGDGTARRDRVKFWAGAGGYPGAALARDALAVVRGRGAEHAADPFALAAEQSSSFRFDWRRDYIPLDAGFSPNEHGDVSMLGYPLVELLAAIGMTNARPARLDRLNYAYGVLGVEPGGGLYDPIFLRAALGAREPPLPGAPFRLFAMRLGWPGQEGQARCITDVIEETAP